MRGTGKHHDMQLCARARICGPSAATSGVVGHRQPIARHTTRIGAARASIERKVLGVLESLRLGRSTVSLHVMQLSDVIAHRQLARSPAKYLVLKYLRKI
jgi:hypothetical protein